MNGVRDLAVRYQKEPLVRGIFARFACNFSRFLEGFIRKERPELIILGGSISRASDLFLYEVRLSLAEGGIFVPIERADLGDHAAIMGAGTLFVEREN